MSIKNFLSSLSALELTFMLIGIAIPIIFIVVVFFSSRGASTSIRSARMFLKRNSWPGEIHQSRIESWQQTNTRYGNNYFFDIYFYLDDMQKLHAAKALIEPGQMHLLRKGLPISVKIGKKDRIAVMQIGSETTQY
jgi:hypothetical protein